MEKRRAFRGVALGGTFDFIHEGHVALLSKAFEIGDQVIIGLSTDEFAKRRGKTTVHGYSERMEKLRRFLQRHYDGMFEIRALSDYFGPVILEEKIDAIVVSEETAQRGREVNQLRRKRGLPELKVVVVGLVLAEDGDRISTERIRKGEIDEQGHLLGKK